MKVQMEDKVIFAEKDKQRLLERKLKKVDENIDDLVAMFLDFVKQTITLLLSIFLTWLVSIVQVTLAKISF